MTGIRRHVESLLFLGKSVFVCGVLALMAMPLAAANSPSAAHLANQATPAQSPSPTPDPRLPSGTFNPAEFAPLTSATLPLENGQRIAMRINQTPITWDDFVAHVRLAAAAVYDEHPGMEAHIASALRDTVMDALILTAIYRQFAKENNLMPEQREIETEKKTVIIDHTGQVVPAARRLTPNQIERMAIDKLIRQKVNRFIGDRATRTPPTQDELTSFTAIHRPGVQQRPTLRARHIVWRATADMSEFNQNDIKARAEEIRNRLKADEETTATAPIGTTALPFHEAARQFSQDRLTAYQGGDLGYFAQGSMYPPVNQALRQLEPGDISPVIQSPVGFHIFQLTERHPDNLRLLYDRYRRDMATGEWQTDTRTSATIETYLEPQP